MEVSTVRDDDRPWLMPLVTVLKSRKGAHPPGLCFGVDAMTPDELSKVHAIREPYGDVTSEWPFGDKGCLTVCGLAVSGVGKTRYLNLTSIASDVTCSHCLWVLNRNGFGSYVALGVRGECRCCGRKSHQDHSPTCGFSDHYDLTSVPVCVCGNPVPLPSHCSRCGGRSSYRWAP